VQARSVRPLLLTWIHPPHFHALHVAMDLVFSFIPCVCGRIGVVDLVISIGIKPAQGYYVPVDRTKHGSYSIEFPFRNEFVRIEQNTPISRTALSRFFFERGEPFLTRRRSPIRAESLDLGVNLMISSYVPSVENPSLTMISSTRGR
jgi:hypothetical protein